jgi:hypothetical protein
MLVFIKNLFKYFILIAIAWILAIGIFIHNRERALNGYGRVPVKKVGGNLTQNEYNIPTQVLVLSFDDKKQQYEMYVMGSYQANILKYHDDISHPIFLIPTNQIKKLQRQYEGLDCGHLDVKILSQNRQWIRLTYGNPTSEIYVCWYIAERDRVIPKYVIRFSNKVYHLYFFIWFVICLIVWKLPLFIYRIVRKRKCKTFHSDHTDLKGS